MLAREAMMRPWDCRTAMAVTISGMRQLERSPVLGFHRLITFEGTSVQ
jgi:hypothetical protein